MDEGKVNIGRLGRWVLRQRFGREQGDKLIAMLESIPVAQVDAIAALMALATGGKIDPRRIVTMVEKSL